MTHQKGQTSVLLNNVSSMIRSKVKANNVSLIEKFARSLYSNMPSEDLASRTDSDLYGAALSLWNSLEKNTTDDAVIRVFNPEVAKMISFYIVMSFCDYFQDSVSFSSSFFQATF